MLSSWVRDSFIPGSLNWYFYDGIELILLIILDYASIVHGYLVHGFNRLITKPFRLLCFWYIRYSSKYRILECYWTSLISSSFLLIFFLLAVVATLLKTLQSLSAEDVWTESLCEAEDAWGLEEAELLKAKNTSSFLRVSNSRIRENLMIWAFNDRGI